MTKRAITRFRVVEGISNQPWIMLEPLSGDDLDMFRGKTIVGFDLPEGTSFDEAQQICEYLSRHLVQVNETDENVNS